MIEQNKPEIVEDQSAAPPALPDAAVADQTVDTPVIKHQPENESSRQDAVEPPQTEKALPNDPRLAIIVADLKKANMSYLERAELVREYYSIYTGENYRHDVGKKKRGRPAKISNILEMLKGAVPGSSKEAQLKWLERTLRIASIPTAVIEKIQKYGLHNRQNLLLKIAKVEGEADQLRKVEEIKSEKRVKTKATTKPCPKGFVRMVVQCPAAEADAVRDELKRYAKEKKITVVQ